MEAIDVKHRVYVANKEIKFENSVLKLSLCDYSDSYILVQGTFSVSNNARKDADSTKYKFGDHFLNFY